MTPRVRNRLIRFIGLPLLILLILIGIAIALLFTQQERIVHFAVNDLNKKFPGRLEVSGSEISVFQHFPYISIGLKNVKFFPDKADTSKAICEAERLYAGFSLPDILRQKYNVKVVSLKNGHLDLVEEPDGQLNIVEAAKITPDTSATTPNTRPAGIDLDIKKIVLKNMDISYADPREGQRLFTHIDRIQSSFANDDRLMDGTLDGTFVIDFTRRGDTTLLRHKHLSAGIKFSYAKATKLLTLPEVRLQLEKAVFNLSGTADLLHDNTVDLSFAGDRPDFKQLFSFAPEKVAGELRHFRYDGVLEFKGTIKGPIKKAVQPRIDINFACTNAWLHNTKTSKKLDSLAFTGYYTNGDSMSLKTSLLRVNDIYARPGQGRFRANFTMRDFTDPKILMQVNSDLELGFFGAFLGIPDLERITGRIMLRMNFNELVDLSQPQKELSELTEGIQSELTVRDLTFRIPDYPYTVDHLNLHANMKNGFVKLDSLVCNIGHSDFRFDGSLEDLPALFHNQQKPVTLNLNVHSRLAVLHELLAKDSAERNDQEEIRDFNIGLSLQTSVNELRHPQPLPKGELKIHDLYASFKKYPHDFHDFGGDLTINDTAVLLRNLAGQIDSSDIRFGGKIVNYALWFEKVKRGKTTLGFDLKSHELAIADVVGPNGQRYLPKDIYNEVGSNIWLRSKMELRYDSVFQFANIRIANISADFQQHPYHLDSISGNIKFGTDNFLKIDTLKGKIGNSDFNLSMRLYTGKDTLRRKKENYLKFASNLLDADQLSGYVASVEQEEQSVATIEAQPAGGQHPGHSYQRPGYPLRTCPGIQYLSNPLYRLQRLRQYRPPALQSSRYPQLRHCREDDRQPTSLPRHARHGYRRRQHQRQRTIRRLQPQKDHAAQQDQRRRRRYRKTPAKTGLPRPGLCHKQKPPRLFQRPDRNRYAGPPRPYTRHGEYPARIDLEILNGVLVNFGPMQALSSYFGDKNLNMIRFDTLRNTLTFRNGVLFIPDMNINSSLGYIEIAGQQSMDTHMEYFLRIPLKLVTQAGFHMLFGKKKEEVDPDQVDAIEYRDREKKFRCMNVKITGTPDDYKVALGKAKKS